MMLAEMHHTSHMWLIPCREHEQARLVTGARSISGNSNQAPELEEAQEGRGEIGLT
jgi:hypothetical protein